jgi:uncharacterized protein
MTMRFWQQVFTPSVRAQQETNGSRAAFARLDNLATEPDRLTESEAAFIAARDSFYMATVNQSGWPYLQHRGGPAGFVKVLDERTLAFADFHGNRQYVSVGNLAADDRAALFFMDYAMRTRLKLLGRVRVVDLAVSPQLAAVLVDSGYKARPERGLLIEVEAFDWNCSQHITPHFSANEIEPVITRLEGRIAELEARLAAAGVG